MTKETNLTFEEIKYERTDFDKIVKIIGEETEKLEKAANKDEAI